MINKIYQNVLEFLAFYLRSQEKNGLLESFIKPRAILFLWSILICYFTSVFKFFWQDLKYELFIIALAAIIIYIPCHIIGREKHWSKVREIKNNEHVKLNSIWNYTFFILAFVLFFTVVIFNFRLFNFLS